MAKPRINLRLRADLHEQLKFAAMSPRVTISEIVEAALDAYFDPMGRGGEGAAVISRLDRLEHHAGNLERDVAVASETIAMFVRYWLSVTPPLPEIDRSAGEVLGTKRFERFMGQVAAALAESS